MKLCVSGITSEAYRSLTSVASAYYVAGDRFAEGVCLYMEPESWALLLPKLSTSQWKGRIAHESHKLISIGGDPREFLCNLPDWGFDEITYRMWAPASPAGQEYVTVSVSKLGD